MNNTKAPTGTWADVANALQSSGFVYSPALDVWHHRTDGSLARIVPKRRSSDYTAAIIPCTHRDAVMQWDANRTRYVDFCRGCNQVVRDFPAIERRCKRCGQVGNVDHDNEIDLCNPCTDAIQGGADDR